MNLGEGAPRGMFNLARAALFPRGRFLEALAELQTQPRSAPSCKTREHCFRDRLDPKGWRSMIAGMFGSGSGSRKDMRQQNLQRFPVISITVII